MVHITQKSAILIMILCTFFASTAHLLLKSGAVKINAGEWMSYLNLQLLLGLVFLGIGAILMVLAFKHGELSILFPILSTGYIWVSLLSPIFFPNDSMNIWKWVGVILILLAVSFLGISVSKKVVENA
jgi:drug/metabolite transporter (DMT)-like permease